MNKPMWWWPVIPLGIVWIAALITCIYQFRKYKAVTKPAPMIVFSLFFAVILFVIFGASNERFTGIYAYYVNGIRVSAGAVNLGQNIFLSLFGGMLTNLSAVGVAYLLTHGIKVGKWMNFASLFLILFGAMMIVIPFLPQIGLTDKESRKVFLIIAAATLIPGILLMIIFQKNKKNIR